MSPKLRVMAGTSPESMVPITSLVNTNKSYKLSSDLFDGEIVAHIKNFPDENGRIRDSEYFAREDRQGITWSIQVRGRFLKPYSADDILFGNTFDRPLHLPWGTSAVLKFMNYIDPTLEHDLQSNTKPWALSPLVSTIPHFTHRQVNNETSFPSNRGTSADPKLSPFPSTQSLIDSTPDLYKTLHNYDSWHSPSISDSSSGSSAFSSSSSLHSASSATSKKSTAFKNTVKKVALRKRASRPTSEEMHFENAGARRAYFSNPAKRQAVIFGPSDVITTDFCYGFIEFSPSLSLRLPGGLSFDLMRYWDGQPIRFVCCERKEVEKVQYDDGNPWGRIFWCITIEACD